MDKRGEMIVGSFEELHSDSHMRSTVDQAGSELLSRDFDGRHTMCLDNYKKAHRAAQLLRNRVTDALHHGELTLAGDLASALCIAEHEQRKRQNDYESALGAYMSGARFAHDVEQLRYLCGSDGYGRASVVQRMRNNSETASILRR